MRENEQHSQQSIRNVQNEITSLDISVEYLTQFILRNHPEITEKLNQGEYNSLEEAALDAGILLSREQLAKPLEELLKAWRRSGKSIRNLFLQLAKEEIEIAGTAIPTKLFSEDTGEPGDSLPEQIEVEAVPQVETIETATDDTHLSVNEMGPGLDSGTLEELEAELSELTSKPGSPEDTSELDEISEESESAETVMPSEIFPVTEKDLSTESLDEATATSEFVQTPAEDEIEVSGETVGSMVSEFRSWLDTNDPQEKQQEAPAETTTSELPGDSHLENIKETIHSNSIPDEIPETIDKTKEDQSFEPEEKIETAPEPDLQPEEPVESVERPADIPETPITTELKAFLASVGDDLDTDRISEHADTTTAEDARDTAQEVEEAIPEIHEEELEDIIEEDDEFSGNGKDPETDVVEDTVVEVQEQEEIEDISAPVTEPQQPDIKQPELVEKLDEFEQPEQTIEDKAAEEPFKDPEVIEEQSAVTEPEPEVSPEPEPIEAPVQELVTDTEPEISPKVISHEEFPSEPVTEPKPEIETKAIPAEEPVPEPLPEAEHYEEVPSEPVAEPEPEIESKVIPAEDPEPESDKRPPAERPRRWVELEQQLHEVTKLPVLPAVFLKVMSLASNPNTDIESLYRVLITDPALSSTLLRLANSAYYGLGNQVKTLRMALVVLGIKEVCRLVSTVAVLNTFPRSQVESADKENFDVDRFWRHNATVAAIAEVISRNLKVLSPEEVYMAGLLHDIGKIFLASYFMDDVVKCYNFARKYKMPLWQAEQHLYSTDHARVGAYLSQIWELPPMLVNCIRYHHEINHANSHLAEIGVVHLANRIGNLYEQHSNFLLEEAELNLGIETEELLEDPAWSTIRSETDITVETINKILADTEIAMKESHSFIQHAQS